MRHIWKICLTLVVLSAFVVFFTSVDDISLNQHHVQSVFSRDEMESINFTERVTPGVKICRRDDLYTFSAVAKPSADWTKYTSIVITSWCTGSTQFNCFLYSTNKNIERVKATLSRKRSNHGRPKHCACQYTCNLDNEYHQIKGYLTQVGLSPLKDIKQDSCPQINKVIYPTRQSGKMAICSKMAYGSQEPIKLIEWFEYNRLMGVDRIITMVQLINRDAYKVLKYYNKTGLLDMDIFPSPLPGIDIKKNANCKIKDRTSCFKEFSQEELKDLPWRHFRRSSPQGEHDQMVALDHCQEKLQGYAFVANVDFDEFIVQSNLRNIKEYFNDTILPKYQNAAGFTLNHSYFLANWGISGDGFLQMTQYTQRVDPRYVNYKNVYIPSRTASTTTHELTPKSGFRRIYLKKHHIVVHHYRTCPPVAYWKNCMNFTRYEDKKMLKIRKVMEERALNVKRELGIT